MRGLLNPMGSPHTSYSCASVSSPQRPRDKNSTRVAGSVPGLNEKTQVKCGELSSDLTVVTVITITLIITGSIVPILQRKGTLKSVIHW